MCNKVAESFEESDPRLARSLDRLSLQSDDPVEIEQLLRRALGIYKKHFSGDYVAIISTIAAIGRSRQRQEGWEAGLPYLNEAIEVGRKFLGKEHLEVVAITMLAGKTYLDHGKTEEAKKLLLQALDGAKNNKSTHWIGANNIASSCAKLLADAYRAEGNVAEADRYTEIQRRHKQSPTSDKNESEDAFLGYTKES